MPGSYGGKFITRSYLENDQVKKYVVFSKKQYEEGGGVFCFFSPKIIIGKPHFFHKPLWPKFQRNQSRRVYEGSG